MSNLPQLTPQMKEIINRYIQERKGNIDPKTIVSNVFNVLRQSFQQPIPINEVTKYVEQVIPLDKEAKENVFAIKRAFSKYPRLSHEKKQSISPELEEIFKKILSEKLCGQDLYRVMRRHVREGVGKLSTPQSESCRIKSLQVTPEQNKDLFLEMLLRYVSETPLEPKDISTVPNTIENLKAAGCKASDVHTAVVDSLIATENNKIINIVYRSNVLLQRDANITRRLLIAQLQNELARISEKNESLEITKIYNGILKALEKYNKNAGRKEPISIETIPLPLQENPTLQEVKGSRDLNS